MKTQSRKPWLITLVLALATAPAGAQTRPSSQYIPPSAIDVRSILGNPPADDSAVTRAELDELLKLQAARTPEQAALCKAQETLTVYAFAPVLGENFAAAKLPICDKFLARAGSNISGISGATKKVFKRQRPFKVEPKLEPIVRTQSPSYPSGHATRGYAWAAILGELFPQKKQALMEHARQIAENRLIGGVHYRSDIEAGRKLGLAIAEKLLASAAFQKDMAAAKEEVKQASARP